MAAQSIFIGDTFISKKYGKIEVIDYNSARYISVRFEDGTVITTDGQALRNDLVANPMYPKVCGIGFTGIGKFGSKTHRNIYNKWNLMMNRCYSPKCQKDNPTYVDCEVAEVWWNFQNYAKDYINFIGYNNLENIEMELDKDILVKGNKLYSKETCVLVPTVINISVKGYTKLNGLSIGVQYNEGNRTNPYKAYCKDEVRFGDRVSRRFLGGFPTIMEAFIAYKIAKEKYIKSLAERYKNSIDIRTYIALQEFEITE